MTELVIPGICILAGLLISLDEYLASRRERRNHPDSRGG